MAKIKMHTKKQLHKHRRKKAAELLEEHERQRRLRSRLENTGKNVTEMLRGTRGA